MSLEFFSHAHSVYKANVLTMSSSLSMSRFLIIDKTSLMNDASSSLFFAIENLDELIFSSAIGMKTVRGT